ncbi:MAG: 5-methyltetrahydropteroyltriglutamate--homocysteine S-methyltransferase [Proteobacteria bacterium]|nr:5-methyltetrahydropteroyltriglutamate--homocysteine S-methyltransferase [Pseudomonadota bacterium]
MQTHNLGFPRIGLNRELKWHTEGYWQGRVSDKELLDCAKELRHANWRMQQEAGIDLIPVGDFSLYDHILDMTAAMGAVPERFEFTGGQVDLDLYFRMARGSEKDKGAAAMEMTKWFDSNYHYIVPEFWPGQTFRQSSSKIFDETAEARAAGFRGKPVLPGPFTYIQLGKSTEPGFDRWQHLDKIIETYCGILAELGRECEWIQLDEPILALDIDKKTLNRMINGYQRLTQAAGKTKIMIATYFGEIARPAAALKIPAAAFHIDLARAPGQLGAVLKNLPRETIISLGLVNGRNIWRVDMEQAAALAAQAVKAVGKNRVMAAPSCSLLHVPLELDGEVDLDPEIKSWLAFAREKCFEIAAIAETASGGQPAALVKNQEILAARQNCKWPQKSGVKVRLTAVNDEMFRRGAAFPQRQEAQAALLNLPPLPTTTIGSFPQTREIRAARRRYRLGEIDRGKYRQTMKEYIEFAVRRQEEAGLDVLVHGEPERNDMVEYFASQLEGFCFTEKGWVQSYGSRCVKPPIIFGDIARPRPMTVYWSSFAQSLTPKPMKAMLTGPVTILCWSFVRDDQPRRDTCWQLALTIRDEIRDLERAGMKIIQIDEPALREGLPMRERDRQKYLDWAVSAFQLATSGAGIQTQIHTHMCYCEFNEIIDSIAALDADVISMEASRSKMALLEAFRTFRYPNDIGPGIIDIHSPRIPNADELTSLLRLALKTIPAAKLWVNPDCGLKTRTWPEVEAILRNMVTAARRLRSRAGSRTG